LKDGEIFWGMRLFGPGGRGGTNLEGVNKNRVVCQSVGGPPNEGKTEGETEASGVTELDGARRGGKAKF